MLTNALSDDPTSSNVSGLKAGYEQRYKRYEHLPDEGRGYRIHDLARPLQPGDSLRLDFEVHIESHGFRNRGVDASVVANGADGTGRADCVRRACGGRTSDGSARERPGQPARTQTAASLVCLLQDLGARIDSATPTGGATWSAR